MSDVRAELRMHADHLPLAGKALAEIERLRAALVEVMAASDLQPCTHAAIARKALGLGPECPKARFADGLHVWKADGSACAACGASGPV